MIKDLCEIAICNQQIDPLNMHTLIFLLCVLVGGLSLSWRFYRSARVILGLTTLYGVGILIMALGPDWILRHYNVEHYFALRLATFIAHLCTTLVSLFLFFASSGKRIAHDSFLYIAAGFGVLVINIASVLHRYTSSRFNVEVLPGDQIALTILSLAAALLLVAHARKLAIHSPFRLHRSVLPFTIFFGTLLLVILLSFKLQRDEIDLLKKTEILFVNSLQLSLKETLDNEVIPLNLLMNLKNSKTELPENDTTLEVARGVLFSRQVMQSLHWISTQGRLGWMLKKTEVPGDPPRLIKPALYYTKITEQADIAIVTPPDLAKDGRVEIVVPYVSEGIIHGYVVAQLKFNKILERAIDQVQFTRFDYGLFSESGLVISSNIKTIDYPGFSHKTSFDIFGKSFSIVTTPNLNGMSEFLSFLPKFTLVFGFFAALLFGHILYMYSNLLTSYDQVENLVKERTFELEEARRVAEAASETKSLFLANMSHEIRTPLNILMGVSEMLAETKMSKAQEQFVNMFKQSCSNLLRLVNDLLDMSKVESGKIELEIVPFNLRSFVEEIISLYRIKSSEKGIDLVSSTEGLTHDYFLGDPLRLKQILGNILINAIKFTDEGAVTLAVTNTEKGVHFKVTDTGIGISQENITNIFERFEQIDKTITRNRGGAGLGLSIAKDLAGLMKGQIEVQSAPKSGTVFDILIPLQEANKNDVLTTLSSENKSTSVDLPKGLKILITDDSPENRQLVKVYLKNYGFIVDEAENGLVALDKMKLKKYDIILMDMQMPVMDGYSATKKIRELEYSTHANRTSILALTAHALREDSQKCLVVGCDAYLSKPVSKTQLMEKLASLI